MVEVNLSRTEELKKYITKQLKKCCDNVFYQKAIAKCTFPYIVYEISYTKNECQYNYTLEINIWGKSITTKKSELLADEIEILFNNEYYTDSVQSLTVAINSRNSLADEDESLKHIRLLFDMQYYYVEG